MIRLIFENKKARYRYVVIQKLYKLWTTDKIMWQKLIYAMQNHRPDLCIADDIDFTGIQYMIDYGEVDILCLDACLLYITNSTWSHPSSH